MSAHIEREIYSQGAAWRSALEAVSEKSDVLASLLSKNRNREVRFLGSGSSYYLGIAASPAWGRMGWLTRALPAGEQVLHPEAYATPAPPLAIGVSRSGSTTETLRALELLKAAGAATIGVSTNVGTPMEDLCDIVVNVTGAQEKSTVQTRSFSAQFLAVQAIALTTESTEDNVDSVPEIAADWIRRSDTTAQSLASSFARVYVLGTGARWGLAMEGALKLKETSLTESEAFHTLEFRHGPKSMVDEDTLIVGLVGETAREAELAVLREMRELGASILAIGPDLESETELNPLSFPDEATRLPKNVANALYLPPLQLMAYRRGVTKGLDPDRPRNLTFAVELEHL